MNMSIFKFTFEDGSEALAHYGVKGMKWGNWNAETRARYMSEGNMPAGGGGLNDDDEEKGDQSDPGEAKPLGPDLSKPIDQHWKEFVDGVKDSPFTHNVNQAIEGGKDYVDNVTTTGRKWGTDANNAGASVSRFTDSLGRGDFSQAGKDFEEATSAVSTAFQSGTDYVMALFGQKRK